MATFLQICQMVARESGTVAGSQPTSVAGQTGRLQKIVYWTQEAWRQIQNSRAHWRWLEAEFQDVTQVGVTRYLPASWNLSRHAEWITDDLVTTAYLQADGAAKEYDLKHLDYRDWRWRYGRGVAQQNQPLHFTISPAGEFCIGPEPDAVYVVKGLYRKSPQELAADGDIPEMPVRFHDLIGWKGLILLAEHDEAQIAMAVAMRREMELYRDLCRDQLPIPDAAPAALA